MICLNPQREKRR
jgi:SRSO17 transposase